MVYIVKNISRNRFYLVAICARILYPEQKWKMLLALLDVSKWNLGQ